MLGVLDQAFMNIIKIFIRYQLSFCFGQGKWLFLNIFLKLPFVLPQEIQVLEDYFMSDHPNRPNVHLSCIFLFLEHFRSHVGKGPHRDVIVLFAISKAEIPDFKHHFFFLLHECCANKNILRFDVPVSDAQLGHVVQSFCEARKYLNGLYLRQVSVFQVVLQGSSIAQFHGDVNVFFGPEAILMRDNIRTGLFVHVLSEFFHDVDLAQNDGFEFVPILFQLGEFDLFEGHPMIIVMIIASIDFSKGALTQEVFIRVAVFPLFKVCSHIIFQTMIEVRLEDLNDWVEKKFDEKYSQKLEPLKKAFSSFYNLIDQISSLYATILEHCKKQKLTSEEDQAQIVVLKNIINRSLLIINKMVEDQPTLIDMLFCDKFIKTFETNLNLLCTYYHSLGHCDILGGLIKFQKNKIVEGINKLYKLHSKIRELFRSNFWDLRSISSHKKFISTNVKHIQTKRDLVLENQPIFQNFESEIEFYEGFRESLEKVEQIEDPKRTLMKSYFNILHQFYQVQAELEVGLQPLISYCQQIKLKKKSSSYSMIDNCNAFLRITSLLLKVSYSAKNLKKIKMEDFTKLLTVIIQEYSQHITNTLEKKKNMEEIIECTIFLIDCVRELDKVESSGLLSVVSEYKDAISPHGCKKFINKLIEYKKYMSYYYQCHESIKAFQRALQESLLLEFQEKVNLVVSMDSSP